MAGFIPAIHVLLEAILKTWMAGKIQSENALRAFAPGMTS
jgi:hypothetical protein